MTDAEPLVAREAAQALVMMGASAREVVPYMSELFRVGDTTVKLLALQTLSQMAVYAGPALGAVKRCLTDSDAEVRTTAKSTLDLINEVGDTGM